VPCRRKTKDASLAATRYAAVGSILQEQGQRVGDADHLLSAKVEDDRGVVSGDSRERGIGTRQDDYVRRCLAVCVEMAHTVHEGWAPWLRTTRCAYHPSVHS